MNYGVIGAGVVVVILLVVFYMLFSQEEEIAPAVEITEEEKQEIDEQLSESTEQGEGDEKVAVVEQKVEKSEPDFKPDEVEGLVGWYTGDSYDEKKGVWKDKSGKGNDATEVRGEPEVIEDKGVTYLSGGATDGVRFPVGVLSTGKKYTMFAVSRSDTDKVNRIIDGYGGGANFLSTYYKGRLSGSHRSGTGWIAHHHEVAKNSNIGKWILSVDQKHLYRRNGVQLSGITNNMAKTPTQMTINYGDAMKSQPAGDWSVCEMLFYANELDTATITKLEAYLHKKYNIPKEVRRYADVRNFYKSERGWLNPYEGCTGKECNDQLKVLDGMGSVCGEDGAMSRTFLERHWDSWKNKKYRGKTFGENPNTQIGSNGNLYYRGWCLGGLPNGGTGEEKTTEYVSLTSDEHWTEKMKKMDMDCRGQPIQGYQYETAGNGSRLRAKYTCSSAPINSESCRDIDVGTPWMGVNRNKPRHKDGGVLSAINRQDLNCGSGQVLTSIKYGEDDAGNVRYKGRCCSLEDE